MPTGFIILLFFFSLIGAFFLLKISHYIYNWMQPFLNDNYWTEKVKFMERLTCFLYSDTFKFGQVIDVIFIWCTFLITCLMSYALVSKLVGWRNMITKQSVITDLKKKKWLNWFFKLNINTQRCLMLFAFILLFLFFYWFFSTNIPIMLWYRVLRLVGRQAYCSDQPRSEKPATSTQQEKGKYTCNKASKSSSKARASTSDKASPSSTKGKASMSSKKNRSSNKAAASSSNQQTKDSTKAEASNSTKQNKTSTKASRPLRLEDLLSQDEQECKAIAADVEKKAILERRAQKQDNTAPVFPVLSFDKGGSNNKVTKIAQGEGSVDEQLLMYDSLGTTTIECAKSLAKLNPFSDIFKKDD